MHDLPHPPSLTTVHIDPFGVRLSDLLSIIRDRGDGETLKSIGDVKVRHWQKGGAQLTPSQGLADGLRVDPKLGISEDSYEVHESVLSTQITHLNALAVFK